MLGIFSIFVQIYVKPTDMKRVFYLLMCVVLCMGLQAQERKIPFNGLLKDANDKPIRKARVYITSPRNYVTTTKMGEFGLTNVQPDDTLKILLNKQTYTVPVDGKKSIIIRLDAENERIEVSESMALVEKGFDYVSRRERDLGTIVTGATLRRSGRSTLIAALQGRVPGLNISGTEAPGSEGSVNIRGVKSFMNPSTPLFVVDGMVTDTLSDIPIEDVDYVEILRDGAIYGARGGNGAILVFTKLP